MRSELLRILSKDGWNEEDLEDLQIIFDGPLSGVLSRVSPDIAELALKELFKKGKGGIRLASKILGVPEKDLLEFFEILKGRRRKARSREIPFEDLIERASSFKPWNLPEDLAEDLKTAVELSEDFEIELSLRVHPYVHAVATSRKWKSLILDGNNFLWRHGLCPSAFEELFLELSSMRPIYFPVYIVFDANVRYVVPKDALKDLEGILLSKRVFLHSPADELIVSLARQKDADVMSEDKFRDYGFKGRIIGYPV